MQSHPRGFDAVDTKDTRPEGPFFTPDLDLASNMFGRLSTDARARLQAVLDNPTRDNWDAAYSLMLNGDTWTTLWQAVIAVDPTFPQHGPRRDERGCIVRDWDKIPTRATLMQAVRYATH